MATIAYVIGGIIGMLVIVRIFLLIAGARFTHWRQMLAAYLAAAIAGTFIAATGAADGGAPNFEPALNQWLGAVIAAAGEMLHLSRRRDLAAG